MSATRERIPRLTEAGRQVRVDCAQSRIRFTRVQRACDRTGMQLRDGCVLGAADTGKPDDCGCPMAILYVERYGYPVEFCPEQARNGRWMPVADVIDQWAVEAYGLSYAAGFMAGFDYTCPEFRQPRHDDSHPTVYRRLPRRRGRGPSRHAPSLDPTLTRRPTVRPGTRVQRYNVTACDARTCDELTEAFGPIGTVLAYDESNSRHLPAVLIRWDNGRLEGIKARDEEADRSFLDVTPRLYVNVYLWDRAYGGPEEGGWWYDTYAPEPEQCLRLDTAEHAAEYLETVLTWAQRENAERHHPHRVISDGHYVARLEAWPPEAEPACRPCYE